jgi:hypothetical protein
MFISDCLHTLGLDELFLSRNITNTTDSCLEGGCEVLRILLFLDADVSEAHLLVLGQRSLLTKVFCLHTLRGTLLINE